MENKLLNTANESDAKTSSSNLKKLIIHLSEPSHIRTWFERRRHLSDSDGIRLVFGDITKKSYSLDEQGVLIATRKVLADIDDANLLFVVLSLPNLDGHFIEIFERLVGSLICPRHEWDEPHNIVSMPSVSRGTFMSDPKDYGPGALLPSMSTGSTKITMLSLELDCEVVYSKTYFVDKTCSVALRFKFHDVQ